MFTDILLVLTLVAAFLYWLGAAQSKEIARRSGKRACDAEDVQFLDDTVVLMKARLRRDRQRRLSLYREYQFEFTTDGSSRYRGEIIIHGRQLEGVTLAPYRIP